MSRTVSRVVVIDTSVVRSAGETEHPMSSACREVLLAILDICHRAVLTHDMREEWKRHMSRFSRKWRRSMAARKKPISVVQPAAVSLDTTAFSPAAQESIEKDMCLLQSALAGDRVIITRDDALSKALSGTDEGAKLVKSITWINPISDGAEALASL